VHLDFDASRESARDLHAVATLAVAGIKVVNNQREFHQGGSCGAGALSAGIPSGASWQALGSTRFSLHSLDWIGCG
jgi:hypothetical protein